MARELKIKQAGNQLLVTSEPVAELSVIQAAPVVLNNMVATGKTDIGKKIGGTKFPCRLSLQSVAAKDFSLVLSNSLGEDLVIGYDALQSQYFIDRSKSGKIDFYNGFGLRHTAPRFSSQANINLTLVIDVSSVELFADDGLTVMTEIFFPNQPYNQIQLQAVNGVKIKRLEYSKLKTIWP
jgi:fructan beta-fructosidase